MGRHRLFKWKLVQLFVCRSTKEKSTEDKEPFISTKSKYAGFNKSLQYWRYVKLFYNFPFYSHILFFTFCICLFVSLICFCCLWLWFSHDENIICSASLIRVTRRVLFQIIEKDLIKPNTDEIFSTQVQKAIVVRAQYQMPSFHWREIKKKERKKKTMQGAMQLSCVVCLSWLSDKLYLSIVAEFCARYI